MQEYLIISLLLLLVCAAGMTLLLDARQRRIDRQLAIALPTSHLASLPSIRRLQAGSRWLFLHRLANYKAGIAYDWHPAYVLLAGVIAAAPPCQSEFRYITGPLTTREFRCRCSIHPKRPRCRSR